MFPPCVYHPNTLNPPPSATYTPHIMRCFHVIKGNKNVDMGAVKKWLEDFYLKYNPEKLKPGYIVKILNQFKGREDDLMLEIRTKYVLNGILKGGGCLW